MYLAAKAFDNPGRCGLGVWTMQALAGYLSQQGDPWGIVQEEVGLGARTVAQAVKPHCLIDTCLARRYQPTIIPLAEQGVSLARWPCRLTHRGLLRYLESASGRAFLTN